MYADETIAAIATPPGKGAIAIVRASGSGVRNLMHRMVKNGPSLQPRTVVRADVVDQDDRMIDRGLALFFAAPNSYTGEDVLELHVHGSPVIAREVLRAMVACGARLATAGEFTRRAFLNGKLSLREAEAVADVIEAESRSAARAALANLSAGLSGEIRRLRASLSEVLEELSAAVDFPDEVCDPDSRALEQRLTTVVDRLEVLRRTGEYGRLVREGLNAAIVGAPNAGKSSLLNALLGEERAIVSDVAGTTRDTIEESVVIGDVVVRLIDTAGIREHTDRLEAAGIARSRRALESARLAIVVVDGSKPLTAEDRAILALTGGRLRVIVANKADLGTAASAQLAGEPHVVVGSVRDRGSVERVAQAIAAAGWAGKTPDLERPHLATLRELDAVSRALDALQCARATLLADEPADLAVGDLQRAHAFLGHVSEDLGGEEVLNAVFARFCIGK